MKASMAQGLRIAGQHAEVHCGAYSGRAQEREHLVDAGNERRPQVVGLAFGFGRLCRRLRI